MLNLIKLSQLKKSKPTFLILIVILTFFNSYSQNQINLDVALHQLPVIFCLDRAGVTGDDGPSHHGVLDLVLCMNLF